MSPKRIAIYAALVLAVLAVLVLVQSLLAVLVSAVVAAAVAFAVSRGRGESAELSSEEAPAKGGLPEWVDHLRELVKLNSALREQACPEAVVAKLEEAFDVLRRLIPELNESYLGSELTWTVNRMATDYLARIAGPYVKLSPAARAEHEAELLKSLAGLEAELENIEGLVRNHQVGDFKAKAAFLRARFLEDKI